MHMYCGAISLYFEGPLGMNTCLLKCGQCVHTIPRIMVSSQHNVCRLLVAMHGTFTKDTQRAMEPALTTVGHSTTHTE